MTDGSIVPSESTDDNSDDDHIPPFPIPVCFDCFANEGQIRCDHMVISVCCLRPESKLDGINSGSWYHCLLIGICHRNSICVRSSMLHRSETWPVRKENEVALQ